MSIMNIKEELKRKKEKVVNWICEHQVETVQTVGALIATGAFIAKTVMKKKDDDDDEKIVYKIDKYYDYGRDNKYYNNSEKDDK